MGLKTESHGIERAIKLVDASLDEGSKRNFEAHAAECLRWGKPIPDVLQELIAVGAIDMPEKPPPLKTGPVTALFTKACMNCGDGLLAREKKCPSCGSCGLMDVKTGERI